MRAMSLMQIRAPFIRVLSFSCVIVSYYLAQCVQDEVPCSVQMLVEPALEASCQPRYDVESVVVHFPEPLEVVCDELEYFIHDGIVVRFAVISHDQHS